MTRRYVPLLLTLCALWGASYLFIKVGVRDLAPTVLVELRLLLAAAVLVGFLWLREGGPGARAALRGAARPGIVLGLVNASFPFVLIAWGERHVDSGVAAVANATVPIFNALLALRFNREDAVSGVRLLGVLAGLLGVAVLAGADPRGGWWAVAGTLAVVVASMSYAAGGIYGQKRLSRSAGPALAAASIVAAAVFTLPFAAVQLPHHAPGWKSLGRRPRSASSAPVLRSSSSSGCSACMARRGRRSSRTCCHRRRSSTARSSSASPSPPPRRAAWR